MGLHHAWGAFITRLVTLGQNEVRQTGRTHQQLSVTLYRYMDSVRALWGSVGQRTSRLKLHRQLADGLFDSESSEEDPEPEAGRLRAAARRLSYDSITQRHEPSAMETQDVTRTHPLTQNVLRVSNHYTGHPTTSRWYTDGSKCRGTARGGIKNGDFCAAFRVHGP